MREWSHVRLFSTWGEVVDPAAEKLLAPTAGPGPTRRRTRPAVTGPSSICSLSRTPSATGSAPGPPSPVSPGPAATGSSTADREQQPFVVHVEYADGREERVFARAVIDASGTWATAGPAGGSGPARARREGGGRPDHLPRTGSEGPDRPCPVRG
ncbi:hypothetical protein GCM10023238_07750 [Streptomyces heliomycini]